MPSLLPRSLILVPSDFESQIQLLVRQESWLHCIPGIGTDAGAEDAHQAHGPWDANHCSTVLTRWLEADLVILLESTVTWMESGRKLKPVTETRRIPFVEALELLQHPERWASTNEGWRTVEVIANTEHALCTDDDSWWVAARGTDRQALDGGTPDSPRHDPRRGAPPQGLPARRMIGEG